MQSTSTVIIVTYKSSHIITNLLDKIVGKFPIKIVDNGSEDDLEEILNEKYHNSGIELTILENNIGFGQANNLALESVKTDYAIIINPDVMIDEEAIIKLINRIKANPKVAACGPIETKSKKPSLSEVSEAIKSHEKAFGKHIIHDEFIEVPFLCGGFVMLNMNILREIGFFDKNIFLYYEDQELSRRIIANGYKNALVKEAICSHFQSSSTKTRSFIDSLLLSYKRNWHIGWSKSYLKKKSFKSVIFSVILKILTATTSVLKLRLNDFVSKIAKQIGILSYCIGISSFNKSNRSAKLVKTIKI